MCCSCGYLHSKREGQDTSISWMTIGKPVSDGIPASVTVGLLSWPHTHTNGSFLQFGYSTIQHHWRTRETVTCPHSPDRDPLSRQRFRQLFLKNLTVPTFSARFPTGRGAIACQRGLFCVDANRLYTQARSCSVLWDSQCRGTRPQRRRRASVSCPGSQHYPPPCLPHGSWEEGGSSSSGAGLLDQGRMCVGKVGSHCGQCGLMQEEQMRISQLLAK